MENHILISLWYCVWVIYVQILPCSVKEIGEEWCWLFMHVIVPLLLLLNSLKWSLLLRNKGKDNLLRVLKNCLTTGQRKGQINLVFNNVLNDILYCHRPVLLRNSWSSHECYLINLQLTLWKAAWLHNHHRNEEKKGGDLANTTQHTSGQVTPHTFHSS